MSVISMKSLLEAGGRTLRSSDPQMEQNGSLYFTERNGIYIIDLQKTVKKVGGGLQFCWESVANGDTVLL